MQNEEKDAESAEDKKTKNLYNALVRDQNSMFYTNNKISNNLIKETKNVFLP